MCLFQKTGLDFFKEEVYFLTQDECTIISEKEHQNPRRFSSEF